MLNDSKGTINHEIPRKNLISKPLGHEFTFQKKAEANWEDIIKKRQLPVKQKKTWTAVCFYFPSRDSTLSISFYPPFTIPRLQTNRSYCADKVLFSFDFRLSLLKLTDFVHGQPVVELLCNNLKTLINRFKTIIFTYGGVEVTASSPQTQQKDQHLALQW